MGFPVARLVYEADQCPVALEAQHLRLEGEALLFVGDLRLRPVTTDRFPAAHGLRVGSLLIRRVLSEQPDGRLRIQRLPGPAVVGQPALDVGDVQELCGCVWP
jgi:hypothetical protein